MDVPAPPSGWRRAIACVLAAVSVVAGNAHAQLENTADVLASASRNSNVLAAADGQLFLPRIVSLNGQPFLHLERWDGGRWSRVSLANPPPSLGFDVALFSSDRVPGLYVSAGQSTLRVQGGVETVLLRTRPRIVDAVTSGGVAKLLVMDFAQQARWAGAGIDAPVSSEARRVRHAAASDDGRVFAVSDLDGEGPGTDHGVFVTSGGAWQPLPGLTLSATDVDVTSIAWDSTASRVVVAGRGLRVDGRPSVAQLAVASGGAWSAWDGGWSADRRVLARRLQDGAVYLVDRSEASLRPQAVLRIDGAQLVPVLSDPPEFATFGDSASPPGMAADPAGLVLDTSRGLMRFPPQGRPELLGLRVGAGAGDRLVAHGPSDRLYVMAEVEEGRFRSDSGAYRQADGWVAVPPLPSGGAHDLRAVAPSDGALVVASRAGSGQLWRFLDAWDALPVLPDPPGSIDQLAVGPNDEVVLVGDGRAVELVNGQWRRIASLEAIHYVAWDVGAAPRLHALRTDPTTGVRHVDARNGSGWDRITPAPAGDLRAFQFHPSGTLIAVSNAFADVQGPAALWWRNGAWEVFRSPVDFAANRPMRTAAGVLLQGGRGPWVMGACSGGAYTVYNATGISPPPAPTIAAAFDGRHAFWIDSTGLRRWAIAAPAGAAIRLPSGAPFAVDVELDGAPATVFAGARLCAPVAPAEVRVTLTGGSPVAGDERLIIAAQPRIEARFDGLTRTMVLRARAGMSPTLSDWQSALDAVQLTASASTYRSGAWRAIAEVDVPGLSAFGLTRELTATSAPSALRLVAPREIAAIAGAAQRLTGVRMEGGLPSDQRVELSVTAMSPGLVASGSLAVLVERIGTTGLRITAERGTLQAWLDTGALQFETPAGFAQNVDVMMAARSGSARAEARSTLRYGGATPVIARPDHLVVPRGSAEVALRVLDNDVFAVADLAAEPIALLSGLGGVVAWVDTGDRSTPADDVVRIRAGGGLFAPRLFHYRLCSRTSCSTTSVRIVPSLSSEPSLRIEAVTDRGERSMALAAIEATPSVRFETSGWLVPSTETVALEAGGRTDPIVVTSGPARVVRIWGVNGAPIDRLVRIGVEVMGADAEILLMAGAGAAPGESTAQCVRSAFGQSQLCELEILQRAGAPLTWWWFAQNLSGSPVTLRAETAVAIGPFGDGDAERLTVTGPSIVPSVLRPAVRVAWDVPTLVRGERRIAWVRASKGNDETVGWQRIELVGATTGVAKADRVLVPGRERRLRLDSGSPGLFVDVPNGASELRVEFTAAEAIAGALRLEGDSGTWAFPPPEASGRSVVNVTMPRAGRYWVRYRHAGPPMDVLARAEVVAVAPRLAAGGYYDPLRPGAGLFVHPAGNQWAGILYSYDAEGLPTWYYLQAPSPDAAGQWSSVVFRSQWAEGRNRLVPVGDALLTALASDRALLTLTIGDRHWRQTLEGFGGGCPSIGGSIRNLSGHWFDTARAGSGYTVQLFPNYEFYALYLYDAMGQPRFLVAEHPRAGALQQAMPVAQVEREDRCQGDCPPVPAGGRTTVGTLSRLIGPSGLEAVDIDVRFDPRPGLSGGWQASDRPVPLGTLQGCASSETP